MFKSIRKTLFKIFLLGSWAREALGLIGSWVLGLFGSWDLGNLDLDSWPLGHLGTWAHLGTWGLGHLGP
jgi:hypothetical protein